MNARSWLAAALLTALSACTCATTAGVLYACGDGGTCGAGQTCAADGLCHEAASDAGGADGGVPDAGPGDAGVADGGVSDAGPGDAGSKDAGATDAGATDGGSTDAGSTDAGWPDAGSTDAGAKDAGSTDAGPPVDAGCLGVGATCTLAGECCLPLCLATTCQTPSGACGAAQELLLDGGVQVLAGTATGSLSQAGGATCESAGGPEAIYAFTTTAAATPFSARVVLADGGPAGLGPVVYLRDACAPAYNLADQACSHAALAGQATVASVLGPGSYFLFLDAPDGGGGAFTLTATSGSAGDSCLQPLSFSLADAGPLASASVAADTTSLTHDWSPSCSPGNNARDAVVALTLPRAGQLDLALSASWDAFLAVRAGSCGAGAEVGCADLVGTGAEALTLTIPAAGTYFVWVGGHANPDKGRFSLEATLR